MMRAQITHVTKDDLFPAFFTAFNIAMTVWEHPGRSNYLCFNLRPRTHVFHAQCSLRLVDKSSLLVRSS
jgi:hypothetical protein